MSGNTLPPPGSNPNLPFDPTNPQAIQDKIAEINDPQGPLAQQAGTDGAYLGLLQAEAIAQLDLLVHQVMPNKRKGKPDFERRTAELEAAARDKRDAVRGYEIKFGLPHTGP